MSKHKEWLKLQEKQTDKTFPAFWEKYCDAEQKIYSGILKDPSVPVEGTFAELVSKYDVDPVLFAGFLDGVNTSLKDEIADLDAIDDDTALKLEVDVRRLYYNMHAAGADHLYTLPEWDEVLTEDERGEIAKEYKRSRTVRVEKKPGRNDPCPCGSGKKYKKCCGQTA
ncbi:MAG: SEC-C domain-containing protein [Clostridiales Family XIII bacterium]|jgi:hypothetical protein|nr:SEC-C domain-containing protein [Clostridiales Family XIII bacterium]